MITYCDEQLAFLRVMIDEPDDDTVRLAYADYLDGLDTVSYLCPTCSGYVDDPCPRCDGKKIVTERDYKEFTGSYEVIRKCYECKGTGTFPLGYHPQRDSASGRNEGGWTNCQTCNGAGGRTPGYVVDASNVARAELIRLQCRIAVGKGIACMNDLDRVRVLIATHSDRFRKGPVCERCKGRGEWTETPGMGYTGKTSCTHCYGTGDAGGLMRVVSHPSSGGGISDLIRVDYVRGMKRVHATFAECVRSVPHLIQNERVYPPADWLRSVLTHHPDVVEVWLTDREPWYGPGMWGWAKTRTPHNDRISEREEVPPVIWELLDGHLPLDNSGWKRFDTRELACTAFARAVVRWGRKFL